MASFPTLGTVGVVSFLPTSNCAVVFPEVLVFYDVPEKATLDAGIMRGFRVIQNRCCHGSPLQQASRYTGGRWRQ